MNRIGKYTNGNHVTIIMSDGTRIRRTNEDKFTFDFAESMDVKITNRCDGGCPMCYEGCTPNDKHGNLNAKWIKSLHPYTEIAINGNDLTHPNLFPFLYTMRDNKVIVNITVNQKHFEEHTDILHYMCREKLIHGLGVSLVNPTQEFISSIQQFSNAVIHVIAGVVTEEQINSMANKNLKLLILGYKMKGRGIEYRVDNKDDIRNNAKYLNESLTDIASKFDVISFDNLALQQLNVKRLFSKEEWNEFFQGYDGESSFYIDAVEGKFAKNSVAPEYERYDIEDMTVDEMFIYLGIKERV